MRDGRRGFVRGAAWLALIMTLCSCWGGRSSESVSEATGVDRLAYEPYDTPVTLRIPHLYSDIQLPEGDTSENNFVTRYLAEQTGISLRYVWEAPNDAQYASKIDLSIRSGDLPDAFVVNRAQFLELEKNGRLEDLTDVYRKYASQLVSSLYDATGGKALQEASVDGKLYGFPNIAIEADSPVYVWVRQDWLDRLGLPAPRDLDDIAAIVRAFRAADLDGNGQADTAGIPVDRALVYPEKMGNNGLNGVFAAFGAFPKRWIAGSEGQPVYGSVRPEAKQALALLARWYGEGILDPQFMLRQDSQDLVAGNQAGLFFGPWWAPYFPLSKSISSDTKAEWRVYAAPLDGQGQFATSDAPATDRYLVVRKGYAHPEAVLKLLNAFTRLERNRDPNVGPLLEVTERLGTQLRNYYPFDLLLDRPDAVVSRHDQLVQALDGKIDPETLDPETKRLYEDSVSERESPRKNLDAWSSSQAYLQGGEVSKTAMKKAEILYIDPTPTMALKWEKLQTLEQETYAKIITGGLPVDAFDSFVRKWYSEGGSQIMAEAASSLRAKPSTSSAE
ncbi:extracellular solute-binding protein [Cohnella thailandensis]|uniref:Extracellular solute-binding protein n=1 Tax=Cohnella thailandensis TaxID=557557 RepID=A0A841T4Z4_9BACL|nr:extracellular solute-binding protein [Cohnella thailandensis]MBP1972025.1 putative aldouronate transport system substrate-binding protein [Cohnella thailandensis]